MKLTCKRDGLLAACKLVGQAVAARTTKPILSNLKAVVTTDALTLTATDLEVGIRYTLDGIDDQRSGAAILPAARLTAILSESGGDELTIEADADGTTVRTAAGRYKLPGGNPDEFPDPPAFDRAGCREVPAGALRAALRRVAFAACRKDNVARWATSGLLWDTSRPSDTLVATDTKRLAVDVLSLGGDPGAVGDDKASHLLPLKAVQLLDRSLTDDGATVRAALRANDAAFEVGPVMIHTRLVEGKFPPYRDIIPKKLATKLTLPVPEFLSRVRQAAVMADDETKRVDFQFSPGRLTLKAQGAETGSSEVALDLPDYDGPEVGIAFDPQYLTEMLRAADGEPTLTLELTDGQKPALFRLGDGYLYLVMPLAG